MTHHKRKTRSDGVRTLGDIRQRCTIDDITGCWIWRYAYDNHGTTTRVWLPDGAGSVVGPGGTTTAARAAWLLSGKPLPTGHIVMRACRDIRCCNPAHGRAGTRVDLGSLLRASGDLRGLPERAAVNARNRQRMMIPRHVVERGEAMYAAGAMAKDVRAALGVSPRTAALIRDGLHAHSTGKPAALIRGASVFALATWRDAA